MIFAKQTITRQTEHPRPLKRLLATQDPAMSRHLLSGIQPNIDFHWVPQLSEACSRLLSLNVYGIMWTFSWLSTGYNEPVWCPGRRALGGDQTTMNNWLSSLKDLLDLKNAVKLSLPGLLGAALLAAILWPPRPIDVIPVVTSELLQIDKPSTLGDPVARSLLPRTREPQCVIAEYNLPDVPGGYRVFFSGYKSGLQMRQYSLEEQKENLERCLAVENQFKGEEQTNDEALQRDLAGTERLRAKEAGELERYKLSDSSMIDLASAHLSEVDTQVQQLRGDINKSEQRVRDREWEIAELTRWKGLVSDRLAEPGKLRPELGFDEYMSALSNHVLAFIFLALTVGMVTEGILTPGTLGTLEAILFKQ